MFSVNSLVCYLRSCIDYNSQPLNSQPVVYDHASLLMVLDWLTPEQLTSTTKMPALWQLKLDRHFPQSSSTLDPWTLFWQTYHKDYKKLKKEERMLFSEVKENPYVLIDKLSLHTADLRDAQGFTLIQWIARNKNDEVLNTLYKNEQLRNIILHTKYVHKPFILNLFRHYPSSYSDFMWAIFCHQPHDIIVKFIDTAPPHFPPELLEFIVEYGSFEAVKYLVEKSVNDANFSSFSELLIKAIYCNRQDYVEYFCNLIDWNSAQENSQMKPVLHWAMLRNNEYFINLLISKEIKIRPSDYKDNFKWAVGAGHFNLVKIMIESGLFGSITIEDLKSLPNTSNTPAEIFLHIAKLKLYLEANEQRIKESFSYMKNAFLGVIVFLGLSVLSFSLGLYFSIDVLLLGGLIGSESTIFFGLITALEESLKIAVNKAENYFFTFKKNQLSEKMHQFSDDGKTLVEEKQEQKSSLSFLSMFYKKPTDKAAIEKKNDNNLLENITVPI
ncbi:MAG: hypothetical protein QM652_07515 [Legionella sp.]|uniref:hypothetical protein n=1 Tax=Legionella sp. TaxID=459 RepID=UPI0039E684BB